MVPGTILKNSGRTWSPLSGSLGLRRVRKGECVISEGRKETDIQPCFWQSRWPARYWWICPFNSWRELFSSLLSSGCVVEEGCLPEANQGSFPKREPSLKWPTFKSCVWYYQWCHFLPIHFIWGRLICLQLGEPHCLEYWAAVSSLKPEVSLIWICDSSALRSKRLQHPWIPKTLVR